MTLRFILISVFGFMRKQRPDRPACRTCRRSGAIAKPYNNKPCKAAQEMRARAID
jgi:hypothetical protein